MVSRTQRSSMHPAQVVNMQSMLVKTGLVALSATLWLVQSLPLQADEIRVVTEYRSFYQQQNEDGSIGGYATEVIQALFALTGDIPLFEVNAWARSYYEAEKNANVLIYSMAFTPAREKLFECVAELKREQLFFWALKDQLYQPIRSLNDLRMYTIAVSQSSNPEQYLTAQGMTNLHRTATPQQAMGMLFKQRADIVIATNVSAVQSAAELGLDSSQLKPVFQLEELNRTLCAAFNKNSDATLRQRYREAFATLRKNGTLKQIRQRWQLEAK